MNKSILLRSCALFVVPLAGVAAIPTAAVAQQITTSINGQVTSETGAPLPGATVTVTDTRTGASRNITADAQGLFNAPNLTTGGPYSITATADGHQGQTVADIYTTLQGPTELTFALAPVTEAVAADTIVVTGARVRATQLEVGPGTSFGQEVMESAPTFNRDVRDVIRLDPRVSLDREDASTGGSGADRITCLGGNDRGNAFTVDGISQGDIYGLNDTGFSSRSSTPLPYDAIRETQVQFAPFDVEYGNFTGCAINVVTRSGTNKFHGEVFFEYANNDMRGDSLDDPQRGTIDVGPIEPDKRWGISLGGPILKDRLFFFGAFERQRSAFSQDDGPTGAGYVNEMPGISLEQFNQVSQILSDVYGIETGPLVTSRPFKNDRYFGRLDWQITDDHRLEGTYQRLEESTVQTDDFFLGSSPQVTGLNTFNLSGTESDYYSVRLYSNWTDRLSTELRYSRSDIQDLQGPVGGGEAQSGDPIPRIIVGIDNPPLGSAPLSQPIPDGAILAGPGTSRSANDLQTKLDQYRAVANYDAGNHRLKFGVELNRADIFNLFVQNATGTLVFRNIADLEQGLLSPGTGNNETRTNGFRVTTGQTEGAFGNFSRTGDVNDAAGIFTRSIYSLYAQDDWRVNDRLDLVLGLRADIFSGDNPDANPTFEDRYGFSNDTGFSDIDPILMPRLGFTYDVSDFAVFSRSKLQGGVGIFSGGDPLVWFGNAFQNNGFGFAEGNTQNAGCPGGQIDVVVGGTFTGVPSCIQASGIATAAAGLGDAQSIDPDIKMPTVFRANIGWQSNFEFNDSAFGRGWRLNLDYIYSRYINPFTVVDLSQTPAIFGGTTGSGASQMPAAIGVAGFTVDGRPIYRSIDPSNVGCNAELQSINPTPVWTGVTAQCFFQTDSAGNFLRNTNGTLRAVDRDDELMLTNSDGYRSHIASFILSKDFDAGIFTNGGSSYFTLGYAYTNAQDRRNLFNSTATSNYDRTAAFDRQNPDASRGFYESRHNVTFSGNFREEFLEDLATSFGFTFVARSGRPYSLTFSDGGVFNDSASGSDNALVYIPTGIDDPNISPSSDMDAVEALNQFARGLDCADNYIGRSIERNTCTNKWYYDLDLRFSQELPGLGRLFGSPYGVRDKVVLYAMFDNFLNFIDKGWNLQHRRNFSGLEDVAAISGVDSQGRYIISNADPITEVGSDGLTQYQRNDFLNVSSSVWRLKVGISYKF